jgi:hypothetical protein
MSLKPYRGSCHCGAVRFEADLDLAAGSTRCNCSLCFKARAWFAFAEGEERFRLLSGADALSQYRWTPPAKAAPFLTYSFCRHCGIRTFCRAELPNGLSHAIPVTTLDDVSPDELAGSPIQFIDMRHDRFDRAPEDVRLL